MHVILTDFRDLARSVMDTGTETIMSAGGQDRALLIWKPTTKAVQS